TFAEPGDWFLRIDADEVLTHVPDNTRRALDSSVWDVGEVTIWEREASEHVHGGDYQSPFRCLFRAIPGIRIEQAHFIVTAPSNGNRVLPNGPGQVPATELWDVRLEHRTHQRPLGRQAMKREYSAMINDLEKVNPLELGKESND